MSIDLEYTAARVMHVAIKMKDHNFMSITAVMHCNTTTQVVLYT